MSRINPFLVVPKQKRKTMEAEDLIEIIDEIQVKMKRYSQCLTNLNKRLKALEEKNE